MKAKPASRFLFLLSAWAVLFFFPGAEGLVVAAEGGSGANTLNFDLFDSYGRKVCSADYAGVPVLLEFGACW